MGKLRSLRPWKIWSTTFALNLGSFFFPSGSQCLRASDSSSSANSSPSVSAAGFAIALFIPSWETLVVDVLVEVDLQSFHHDCFHGNSTGNRPLTFKIDFSVCYRLDSRERMRLMTR